MIGIVTSYGKKMELEKEDRKVPGKDTWETLYAIPLIPLSGVNHCKPILHVSKIMVQYYYIDETIHQFAIGYMIKPSLHFKKLFIEQVETFLSSTFYEKKMETIKYYLRNKNTCVMTLIMFYDNNGLKPKKMYRVLSCVIYYLIENYVCIDYL